MKKIQLQLLIITLIAFLLIACEEHGNSKIEKAKIYISHYMKDPDSVKFRSIVVNNESVCGEVNAKNSYGAYIGYVSFHVSFINEVAYKSEIGDANENFRYDKNCTSKHEIAEQERLAEIKARTMNNSEIEKWIKIIARKNNCTKPITIVTKTNGAFEASCTNKILNITCETPILRPTGGEYYKLPNCWI